MELLFPCPLRLPFDPDKTRARRPALRVVGCCNGLLCILQQETDLILWNPATSEAKFVPNSPFGRPRAYSVGVIGFGFDPETNDYKIVRPLHENVMCCLQCRYFLEVYSLRTDSWNKYDDFPHLGSKMPQCRQGKLYWWKLMSGKKGLVFDSFEIRGEVFDKVKLPCPPASKKYGTPACLLKEESMLAVFPDEDEDSDDDDGFGGGRKNWSAATWEIWVLLKYWLPGSWTKLYVVTSPLLLPAAGTMTTLVDCAGISSNLRFFFVGFPSDLVDENGNYWGDRSLLTLEIATGEFTRSHIEAICFEVVTDYVPSRVSLQSYSSARTRHK